MICNMNSTSGTLWYFSLVTSDGSISHFLLIMYQWYFFIKKWYFSTFRDIFPLKYRSDFVDWWQSLVVFLRLNIFKYCFWSLDALIIDSDSIIGLLGALINASLGMSGSDSEDIDDSLDSNPFFLNFCYPLACSSLRYWWKQPLILKLDTIYAHWSLSIIFHLRKLITQLNEKGNEYEKFH